MPQNKVNTFQPIGKPGMLADGYQVPSCMAWVMASNGNAKPAMPPAALTASGWICTWCS